MVASPPARAGRPPWEAFADDQLGLMDHLGIDQFFYMGYCIGGCFAGTLLQRAPDRVAAVVFSPECRPSAEKTPPSCTGIAGAGSPTSSRGGPTCRWTRSRHTCTTSTSCSPIFCTACRATSCGTATPILVLPDDIPSHPLQTSIDIASRWRRTPRSRCTRGRNPRS